MEPFGSGEVGSHSHGRTPPGVQGPLAAQVPRLKASPTAVTTPAYAAVRGGVHGNAPVVGCACGGLVSSGSVVCGCSWGEGALPGVERGAQRFGRVPSPSGVLRWCPTLPHPPRCSTIGAVGLSFRVRNGYRAFPPRHDRRKTVQPCATLTPPVGVGVCGLVVNPHSGCEQCSSSVSRTPKEGVGCFE